MDSYHRARKFGITVILLSLLFRLLEAGLPQRILTKLPDIYHTFADKETGQEVRSLSVYPPHLVESAPPAGYLPEPDPPVFSPEDAGIIRLVNSGSKQPNLGALIAEPLHLNLTGKDATVLILHTHTTESYTRHGETYPESAAYRTLDENYNMLSIGERVAEILEGGGIRVIHDRQLHDYPSYTGAYNHARAAIQEILEAHPGIQLVLDLHRDAMESGGQQLRTLQNREGPACAQLMLVMGCGNSGLSHPRWQQNLALALKLQAVLEQQSPGICRPISLRGQRYNQDLSPGALLVEVGSAGNSHAEALRAAEQLAQAILTLKNGSHSRQPAASGNQ